MKSIVTNSRVAVVGLGQLGASLALRLKQIDCPVVHGIARSRETIDLALAKAMIDDGSTNPADILPHVDITFICLPMTATIEFVQTNLALFRQGSVVTDVGSAKTRIVRELRDRLLDAKVYFVGAHPMAGSEKAGFAAATQNLFNDCTCFMTPTPDDDEEMLAIVAQFWREIGACVIELPAERHDDAVAAASHLLHLLSATMVHSVLGSGDVEARALAAAGAFRDMSRIAGSSASMWTEICRYNVEPIRQALGQFYTELERLRKALANEDWDDLQGLLETAAKRQHAWLAESATRSDICKDTLNAKDQNL